MDTAGDLRISVRITVSNSKSASSSEFGYGVASLCRGVYATGSLNAAAKRMGMSYSKAWHIVHNTEEALGLQLLVRDGARGSRLTPECARLLEVYDEIWARLDSDANRMFAECFE